jgi:hypothetical protein
MTGLDLGDKISDICRDIADFLQMKASNPWQIGLLYKPVLKWHSPT